MKELAAIGWKVEGPLESGGFKWLLVPTYTIPGGSYSGQVVRVAVPVADDYPQTPPGGLYVSRKLVPAEKMSGLNIHDRAETSRLSGEWQYWSRPIPPGTWTPNKGAKRLVAHWNAVMMNV